MDEKSELITSVANSQHARGFFRWPFNKGQRVALTFITLLIGLDVSLCLTSLFQRRPEGLWRPFFGRHLHHRHGHHKNFKDLCPQVDALFPSKDKELDKYREIFLHDEEYRNHSLALWSGAVQIETTSYDDMKPVGEDPRYEVFPPFASYLEKSFPLVYVCPSQLTHELTRTSEFAPCRRHKRLTKTLVNTHGLLFTWKGSDPSLKPLLLMAHQDTVPVNPATLDKWTYPPWSGHFDGHFLWGRGSSDCKNQLTAELEAVESLLSASFTPLRTVLLSFGFDEESKGRRGAGELALFLEGVYGSGGVEMIVDEGGLGIGEVFGAPFAMPATGEKGYIDVNISISTPGGHSSVPPPHTGIGILSSLITSLESHPYPPSLSSTNPYFSLLECAARWSPETPEDVRVRIVNGGDRERREVARWVAKRGGREQFLVQTSQAIDIVSGGVKVNALPELVYTVVNHRVSVDSSTKSVKQNVRKRLAELAEKFSLDVEAFGEDVVTQETGRTMGKVKAWALNEMPPAPTSPTGPEVQAWKTFSGVIKGTWGDIIGKDLVVSPAIMTGNTDTRYYWNLTKNIYRFTPTMVGETFNIHTVDEHMALNSHLETVLFFHNLIRVMNAQ